MARGWLLYLPQNPSSQNPLSLPPLFFLFRTLFISFSLLEREKLAERSFEEPKSMSQLQRSLSLASSSSNAISSSVFSTALSAFSSSRLRHFSTKVLRFYLLFFLSTFSFFCSINIWTVAFLSIVICQQVFWKLIR